MWRGKNRREHTWWKEGKRELQKGQFIFRQSQKLLDGAQGWGLPSHTSTSCLPGQILVSAGGQHHVFPMPRSTRPPVPQGSALGAKRAAGLPRALLGGDRESPGQITLGETKREKCSGPHARRAELSLTGQNGTDFCKQGQYLYTVG